MRTEDKYGRRARLKEAKISLSHSFANIRGNKNAASVFFFFYHETEIPCKISSGYSRNREKKKEMNSSKFYVERRQCSQTKASDYTQKKANSGEKRGHTATTVRLTSSQNVTE